MTAADTPSRPATIVISDWLANCRAGQWTPFEAATALKAALEKAGYAIVAAKPADDGVREATTEEMREACARLVETTGLNNKDNIARDIRALSTKAP